MKPIQKQLQTLNERFRLITLLVPNAIDHLNNQIQDIVSLKAAAISGSRSKNSISDPTGDASGRISHATVQLTVLYEALSSITTQIDRIDTVLQSTPKKQHNEPRCQGGTPPWGDRQCGELVEYYQRNDGTVEYRAHGLCGKHRRRRDRAQQETPRTRSNA